MKKTALKIIVASMLSVITISGSISALDFFMAGHAEPVEIICPIASMNSGKCHIKLNLGERHVCIYTGITSNFCSSEQNSD